MSWQVPISMRMHSNTIFITGGSSGIGRGLAEAFHKLGNQVIISGRREAALMAICEANPGMRSFVLDVTDPAAVREIARHVAEEFPDLNCVFNNAGVQKHHDFASGEPLDEQAVLDEINTNLLGVIRVATAFLPHLRRQPGLDARQRLVGPCLRPSGPLPRLLCDQGRRPLVHDVASASIQGNGRQGDRTGPALRRHRVGEGE